MANQNFKLISIVGLLLAGMCLQTFSQSSEPIVRTATTQDGRVVVLFPNGTWVFQDSSKHTVQQPLSQAAVLATKEALQALDKVHDGVNLGATVPEFRRLLLDAKQPVRDAIALVDDKDFKYEMTAAVQDMEYLSQLFSDYLLPGILIKRKSADGELLVTRYGIQPTGDKFHPANVMDGILNAASKHETEAGKIVLAKLKTQQQ